VPSAPTPRPGTQKKRLTAAERDPAARAAWWGEAAWLDPADLVFVDETSTHTALTRLRARAPRGEWAVGAAPRNHGPNVTLLAALTPAGIAASLALEGATDRLAFEAFVAQVLVPTLRPGQVVVLDNLSAHKGDRVRASVEAAGCTLLFLPAYSPDFNPIELAFSQLKAALRRVAARTFETLVAAIGAALAAITPAAACGFYAHCGFPLSPRDQAQLLRRTV
jgi:transposase